MCGDLTVDFNDLTRSGSFFFSLLLLLCAGFLTWGEEELYRIVAWGYIVRFLTYRMGGGVMVGEIKGFRGSPKPLLLLLRGAWENPKTLLTVVRLCGAGVTKVTNLQGVAVVFLVAGSPITRSQVTCTFYASSLLERTGP